MKKFTAIMMALMIVLTLTQCKPDKGNEGDTPNGSKVKVSCVIPMNKNTRSEFDNLMTDGSIKWSAGTERIYLAIPNETNPQIVELTAFTTVESNILLFEGEVEAGLLTAGEYDIWYLGNSKESGNSYITETKEGDIIKSISGSIASQSGDLNDLGYCHIAMTKVTAETEGEEVVLSLNGTLKNQVAIAHLDLEGITNLKGDAIVGTEYTLQYNNGAFEFAVTPDAKANITVTEGTTASYVVLFPNSTANVDLKSNTSKKVTFEGGVEANKIYYKHVSDTEFYPLTWEDYEEETNTINGHEYVDLGLPSGLLWATCNVGAISPEEYGDYFAWGETTIKKNYYSSNSLTEGLGISELQHQGYVDDNCNLMPQHDVATAKWGAAWRMPTRAEQQELLNNCTWEWINENGVNGYMVIGPNGNSIFIPAAGYRNGSLLNYVGKYGHYWSSTSSIDNNSSYRFFFYDDHVGVGVNYMRRDGFTVRPVSIGNYENPEEPEISDNNGHEYVDLGLSVKWATCNVGANSPEECGNYYAWGEIITKETYGPGNSLTSGVQMNDISGNAQYDVARANWEGSWRIPSYEEFEELSSKCMWTWTSVNGVNGYKITGRNDNSIFLPAAGMFIAKQPGSLGDCGYYWTSTPDIDNECAYYSNFRSSHHSIDLSLRHQGISVRPVID